MLRIPLLRAGRPYHSLATTTLCDLRSAEPLAELSLANSGLIALDLADGSSRRRALEALPTAELIRISGRAAQMFASAELPLGDGKQTAEAYLEQLSATTGMPRTLARRNQEKIRFVLSQMATVLAGLTRGLEPEVLDRGWGLEGDRCISFRPETDSLGVILPSNSPGVHSLWLTAIPLKVLPVLKPGSMEPWTPYRLVQAFIAAGCPAEVFAFYPTDYAGAAEILLRCGRSMLFGDRSTVDPWRNDPRVQIHGPGWSKVILADEDAAAWQRHLELIVRSVVDNGGRSCINASGVWTTRNGRELAEALAERLAVIEALPLEHPSAELAAFPSLQAAQRLSAHIDSQLEIPGAIDLTALMRPEGRVAVVDGLAFLLPTVVLCEDPSHPLAQSEYLFPFVSVVEVSRQELVDRLGPTLVMTALTREPRLQAELMRAPRVERLNLGAVPTSQVSWDQPHEGNLFEHLYRQRALQVPDLVRADASGGSPQEELL